MLRIGPCARAPAHPARPARPRACAQSLEAIARLNKGFKADMCTRTRPQIGERSAGAATG